MQIKEAKEKDIPEILEVLRASLGEVSSKKTEKVWRFKHILMYRRHWPELYRVQILQ